ncbi:hypothetical protein GCM10027030_06730 [Luteococcus sediminum]
MKTLREARGERLTADESRTLDQLSDQLSENDLQFIEALIAVREQRGLSQSEVAEIMQVSQPVVSKFESLEGNPTLATIRRYANAIQALYCHKVEAEAGQLDDDRATDWVSTTMSARVTAQDGEGTSFVQQTTRNALSVTWNQSSGGATVLHLVSDPPSSMSSASDTNRSDFALAG